MSMKFGIFLSPLTGNNIYGPWLRLSQLCLLPYFPTYKRSHPMFKQSLNFLLQYQIQTLYIFMNHTIFHPSFLFPSRSISPPKPLELQPLAFRNLITPTFSLISCIYNLLLPLLHWIYSDSPSVFIPNNHTLLAATDCSSFFNFFFITSLSKLV